ncbi:hypothetical protein CRG98_021367 [Punica granatum]|uniref:Uncharacterized protein n=1 Tax=Punica granatum TaxID=22663 RepID=A0A2I0JPR4_PUNGR|nr:hypothetical protein CRG98_021367 [Punica granatum]
MPRVRMRLRSQFYSLQLAPLWLDARIEDSAKDLKNPILVIGNYHGTSNGHFLSSYLDCVGKNEVEAWSHARRRCERSTVGKIPAGDKQYRDDLGYDGCEKSIVGMIPAVDKQYRDDLGYDGCKRSTVGMIPAVKVMRKVNSRDDPDCQSSKLIDKQYRDDLGYAGCKRCERSTVGMIPAVDKQYRDDLGYAGCKRSTVGMIPAVDKQYRDDLGYAGCERSTVGMSPAVDKQYRDDLGYAGCKRSTVGMILAVDKQYQDDLGYAGCKRKRRMTLVVSECGCKAAVLRIGLTLGIGLALSHGRVRTVGGSPAKAVPNCLDGVFSCPLCLRKVPSWTVGFVLWPVSLFEPPRLCITEAALGVPHRRTPPSSKYKEKIRDKFSGKRELAHRSSPVVNVPL